MNVLCPAGLIDMEIRKLKFESSVLKYFELIKYIGTHCLVVAPILTGQRELNYGNSNLKRT